MLWGAFYSEEVLAGGIPAPGRSTRNIPSPARSDPWSTERVLVPWLVPASAPAAGSPLAVRFARVSSGVFLLREAAQDVK